MIQKIDNATVREAVQQAYERCKNETGGKNADYIPYLANVPSTLFGIAACLPDGEVIAVGDTDYKFGIESVSKVPTAILAMNQYSAQEVLTKIGADATGLPFNSIMAILLENDHPSTPLVNAGAISACSMVQPVGDSDGKWKAITGFIEGLAGSQVEVIDELYKSETATNFNNKSIAWLLKNYNRIYDDPDMALDIYTRQCSIGVTAKQLATMAATIANGGKNPVTKQQVFKPELSPKIASMMATVGFYEHTGDWLFTTGLPAKTGVGGGIMGVVPGVMGVAAFAPPARRGRQLGQGTEGAGLHRRAPQPQYFRHHALRDGREGSGAGVDLRRQLGKRPAHVMRRPFPIAGCTGRQKQGGGEKNGYGRTNNSDAVQGRRIHRPNRTRRRHTTCGLRKKSKGAGANSPTGLANRFWKLPLRPSRPGTRPGHSKGFRQIYARRTCHIT